MKKLILATLFFLIAFKGYNQKVGFNGLSTDSTLRNAGSNKTGVDSIRFIASKHYVDSVVAAAGGGRVVDSIWRVAGIDSIYYSINSTQYAIKDSTGGGSTSIDTLLAGTAMSMTPYSGQKDTVNLDTTIVHTSAYNENRYYPIDGNYTSTGYHGANAFYIFGTNGSGVTFFSRQTDNAFNVTSQ